MENLIAAEREEDTMATKRIHRQQREDLTRQGPWTNGFKKRKSAAA